MAIQDGNCPGEGVSDPFVSIRDQATKTHDYDVGFYAQFLGFLDFHSETCPSSA